MRRKKIIENAQISGIEHQGKGLFKVDGKVVFVPATHPGDNVDIKIVKNKKQYAEGRVLKYNQFAPYRIEAFCPNFGNCGGCKWQNIPYTKQLEYKAGFVKEAFEHIGKLDFPEIEPIIACEEDRLYRNKMEYSFSNRRWLTKEEIDSGKTFDVNHALGFHVAGAFDKVLDIETCYLQSELSDAIRNEIRAFTIAQHLDYYDLRAGKGLLRGVIVRKNTKGDYLLLFSVANAFKDGLFPLYDHLLEKFPAIKSLNYIVNNTPNDAIYPHKVVNYAGEKFITEQLNGVQFKIGPKSFFQTNTRQAEILYSTAIEMLELKGSETIYDLYTGIGSIALSVAAHCEKVVGIEQVEDAIKDAKENAQLNKMENAHFYTGDVRDLFNTELIGKYGKPDIIITDPPRAGMHKDVVKALSEAAAPKLLYISCNPNTQARDLEILCENYRIEKVQPVDMFPQTHHIENIVLLGVM
ncbi:MAG: 23S rRNA (uracil(1939)-C(5))-methyltransferase RlmD [Chitinophagales bacterium]